MFFGCNRFDRSTLFDHHRKSPSILTETYQTSELLSLDFNQGNEALIYALNDWCKQLLIILSKRNTAKNQNLEYAKQCPGRASTFIEEFRNNFKTYK